MKDKCLLFVLLVLITHGAAAQDSTISPVSNISKVTFWDPGFNYELKLGEKHTLSSYAFAGSFYIGYSSAIGTSAGFWFNPGISEQFRYYYNGAKRAAKGKRTDMNSMNYVSAKAQAVVFSDEQVSNNVRGRLTQEFYYFGPA